MGEPVAWMWETRTNRGLAWTKCGPPKDDVKITPLYAHPLPSPPPAAETGGEDWFKRYIEARDALYQFNYPPDPKMLREIADEIDCGADCEHGGTEWDTNAHVCSRSESKDGCASEKAWYLRQFADAIDVRARLPASAEGRDGYRKLDTPQQVFFYEQDFYVLSNFSAFRLDWKGTDFDTAEAAYHWEKFHGAPHIQTAIKHAISAHEAFKTAENYKALRRPDWDNVKVGIMREILRAKADQHEYVRRKLLATGDRELVEDSWRDDFWGWGPNRDGQNVLGKLWMEVRAELRSLKTSTGEDKP